MRIPYWKRVYIRKDRTIWENTMPNRIGNNRRRVYVQGGTKSWSFGTYEKGVIITFQDTPTKDKHINLSRNKRAAFEYAVKYMRDNPK